jgi:hypothetical protein
MFGIKFYFKIVNGMRSDDFNNLLEISSISRLF